jgi:hypothetical protein
LRIVMHLEENTHAWANAAPLAATSDLSGTKPAMNMLVSPAGDIQIDALLAKKNWAGCVTVYGNRPRSPT